MTNLIMRDLRFLTSKSRFFPILIFIQILLFSSCTTVYNTSYFKTLTKDTTIQKYVSDELDSKILAQDVLGITVSSLSKDLDDRFNTNVNVTKGTNGTVTTELGYTINNNGEITMHMIGKIAVVGLTRKELKYKIENLLTPYLKEPIVSVKYLNRKLTIMGNVNNPQVFYLNEEKISILDALVLSGDLKENATTSDVIVIRDEEGVKNVKHINLQNHSIFNSSWYYLKPNDIVYVGTDYTKIQNDKKKQEFQNNLSIITTATSLLVLIINLVKK